MTLNEIKNIVLSPGKKYEIEFVIPNDVITDQTKLQKNLASIQTNLINHPDIKATGTGKLIANKLIIPFELRPTSSILKQASNSGAVAGLGIVPAILVYALGIAIITIFAGMGLNWTVNAIREISVPLTTTVEQTTKNILPVLIVIAVILLTPTILQYIPKGRR